MNQQITKTATAQTFAFNAAAATVCDRVVGSGIRMHLGKPLSEIHRSKSMETGCLSSVRESMPSRRYSPVRVPGVSVMPPVESELPAPLWALLAISRAVSL
ncbi:hypothetical protein [Planctomyces sp. SH-PL14]|uniref:hypothetical protein n=1 Tax=Planctomyces sp. SH-PL14 TaxID=1632864 RepID=UPI0012E85F65|nr:hypothetical protein [Planctomyces sp. SH-PL14]